MDFVGIKNVAVFEREQAAQERSIDDDLVIFEDDALQSVSFALFHRHGDVHGFAGAAQKGNRNAAFAVVDLGFGVLHQRFVIAALLVGELHALRIFFQLGRVESAGKQVFQEDGVRNPDGLKVFHGTAQFAAGNVLVAHKTDVADLYFGAFFDNERETNGRRRYLLQVHGDGGELPSVLGQQLLKHHLGLDHFCRIVRTFHRQRDFGLLVTLKDVAGGNGTQAAILDGPDGRLLADINVNEPAFG